MSETEVIEHRQFPIGAATWQEVAAIANNPLWKDRIESDALMADWKQKSQAFNSLPQVNPVATDADLRPLGVAESIHRKVESVVSSYKNAFPPIFDLMLVPIEKLVTPQKWITLERARGTLGDRSSRLTEDEIAEYCLGTPANVPVIDATFLGQSQPSANQIQFTFQFSSSDLDIRPLVPTFSRPFLKLDWSGPGSQHRLPLMSIPFSVGPGPSIVQVAKVPAGGNVISVPGVFLNFGPAGQAPQQGYRLIIMNGVHRTFRLMELGHSHVAALVYSATINDFPPVVVDTLREQLFSQRPLMMNDLNNPTITRLFEWKRSKKVWKLQLTLQPEQSFV